jgi:hypothetical protein
MDNLAMKRDQHDAALSYLDTGTLALADVLALLDDAPAEDAHTPNVARRRRRGRGLLRGVRTASLLAAAVLGTLALAPTAVQPAEAASAFDDPTYTAAVAAAGWQCVPLAKYSEVCTGADGRSARVDAFVSDEAIRYVGTGEGRRNDLVVYRDDAAEARDTDDARARPDAYPNLHTGPHWIMWGTNPTDTTLAARPLPKAPATRGKAKKPSAAH